MTTTVEKSKPLAPSDSRNKGGAPTKYSEHVAQTIVAAVEDGCPITHAATIAGVSYSAVCSYRKQFPDFDERVKQAIALGIKSRLDVVKKAMQSKDENVSLRAATWWLTHVPGAAEHFSESRRLEISGPDGQPLTGAVAVYLPQKDDDPNGKPVVTVNAPMKEVEKPRNSVTWLISVASVALTASSFSMITAWSARKRLSTSSRNAAVLQMRFLISSCRWYSSHSMNF
jgi:hypothetical protein